MPVSTPKYKNLFCQTLKKQVLIRGFLLYYTVYYNMDNSFIVFEVETPDMKAGETVTALL